MTDWWPTIAAALWGLSVAGIGGALTDIGPWFKSLRRPPLQPPDWLFGPAWTVILTMTATAGVFAWNAADGGMRAIVVALFVLNGLLNVGWNVCYFVFRRPDWALVEVPFLWLSILAMVIVFSRISATAAWLVVPYLLWVGFASWLNRDIVRLNGPFQTRRVTT